MKHVYYTLFFCCLSLTSILPGPGVQAQSITQGLVGHWTFDGGTLADSSGNGFSGTLMANRTPLTTICGVKGDAVQFPGDRTWVEFNNGINAYFDTSDITVAYWFRLPPGSGKRSLVSKRRNNNPADCCFVGNSFDTRASATRVRVVFSGWFPPGSSATNSLNYAYLDIDMEFGCWHHLVVVRRGRHMAVYFDGELRDTAVVRSASPSDLTNSRSVLGIGNGECFTGNCTSDGEQAFNGAIDELRVYDRALSATEAYMLYRDPLPYITGLPADTTICTDVLQLLAVNNSCAISVAWEPAANINVPNAFSTSASFALPSQTAITAAFTDQWGCVLTRDTVHVSAFPTPEVQIQADTLNCTTVAFRALSSAGTSGLQYDWQFGDGNTGSGDSVTYSYASGGPFTVVLRATGAGGCTGYDTLIVDVDIDKPLDLGPDTTICLSDTMLLYAGQGAGMRYLWSTGTSDSMLRVISGGTYWLEVERNNCKRSDTIRVSVIPRPGVLLGNDTIICEAAPLRIGSAFPTADYLWSTGSEEPYILVNTTGSYWLKVSVASCTVSDTINITAMPPPGIDLGNDRDICDKQTIALDATWADSRYRWNTGDTTAVLTATSAGFYRVAVTDAYSCVATDSVILHYYPHPEISIGPDTVVCEETPLLIRPWHINTDSLMWSDGSAGWTLSVKHGGQYIVSAINKCGMKADTISIRQIFCDIMVPGAFSPNGDGLNDILRVLGNTGRLEGFSFSVFNRWGEEVFRTNNPYRGWDGWYKGAPAQSGTYVYMLEYSIAGKPDMLKGDVHLIR